MLVLEIAILSIIVIFQFYTVGDIIRRISTLKSIFNDSPILDNENKQFVYEGSNSIKKTIIETINKYIQKNEGGIVDFHIIKDIVERNVDTIDEEVSNKLPTPLYLGLAGTMVGIIVGLFYVDISSNSEDMLNISPLIDGVKYAMSVSVLGLLLTTVLSVWTYKNAKSSVNEGKNNFLSQIQTELLPTLIRSDDAAIQELSKELRVFSKAAPHFVNSLEGNTNVVKETIEKEIKLLDQIKSLDVKRLSQSNLEIFNSLSEMMDSFRAFPEYYQELNRSLGKTTELNENLHNLVSSSQDVNKILEEVKGMIETGNSAASFFNQHIKSFENYSDAISLSIANTNQSFDKSLGQLKEAVSAQMEAFNLAISEYDSKLSKSFDKAIEKYNAAFENAIPGFENLYHLKKLDAIQDSNNKLSEIQNTLLRQSEILENLNIQLPDSMNLKLQREKGIYMYLKDGLFFVAGISVTVVSIYLAFHLT